MTYTLATLEVSPAAYDEIRGKLEAAGYQHAIDAAGTLDMTHIGLVKPTHRCSVSYRHEPHDWCDGGPDLPKFGERLG